MDITINTLLINWMLENLVKDGTITSDIADASKKKCLLIFKEQEEVSSNNKAA